MMKRLTALALGAFALSLSLLCLPGGAEAEKYAVVVGINDYLMIFPDLQFCEDDARLFREVLIETMGFKPENIKMLLGKEATKKNIMEAVTKWLASRVKPGDKAVFYFSGHGIQLEDDNGDEEDGKDETLCAYDSWLYDITFIRDDELDRWFEKVNTNDKLVILDCCHSGTATKDVSIWNTVKEFYPPEPIRPVPPDKLDQFRDYFDEDYYISVKSVKGYKERFEDTVLVAACAPHQVAIESKQLKHGLLTYYLTKGLRGPADANGDGVITVEEGANFARKLIKSEGWEQDPQLEGDYVGKTFVGEVRSTVPYGLIAKVEGQIVRIDQGSEDGAVKGAIYAVFDADRTDLSGEGKGRIKVIEVSEKESKCVVLEGEVKEGDKVVLYAKPIESDKLLVFVEEPRAGDDPLLKKLAPQLKGAIEEALKAEKFIQLVSPDTAPDKLIRTTLSQEGELVNVEMRVINVNLNNSWRPYLIKASPDRIADAGKALINSAMNELRTGYVVKNLAKLTNETPAFRINLTVDKGEGAVYKPGETIKISVQPTRDCYITIIDITTSGKVYVLFPNEYEKDNFVRAGQKFTIPSVDTYEIEVGGPPGIETIKAIATTKPLDLSSVNPDDPSSPIKFFSSENAFQLVNLPVKDLNLRPVKQWATETVTIRIGEESIYGEREPLLLPQLE